MNRFNFEKTMDVHEKVQGVGLPKKIEDAILGPDQLSPLSQISARMIQAGVGQEKVERYKAAVLAFTERPSRIRKGEFAGFGQQDIYFAPLIDFKQGTNLTPLSLNQKESLKLVLSSNKILEESTISPEEALERFTAVPLEAGVDTPMTTPEEAFLAQHNRFMYSLHEPLHIYQGLNIGDRVNRLKDEIGADAFDGEKEKAFLVSPSSNFEVPAEVFDQVAATPFFPFDKDVWAKDARAAGAFVIANNEATMDVMADEYSRELLRRNPAVLLNVHNTLVIGMQALKKLKQVAVELAQRKNLTVTSPEALDMEGRYDTINFHLSLVSRMYFAAFDSEKDALDYFNSSDAKVLGRKVSGKLLVAEDFDAFDLINLSADVKLIVDLFRELTLHKQDVSSLLKTYISPSGESHFQSIEVNDYEYGSNPVTRKGADIAARIFTKGIEIGKTASEISQILNMVEEIGQNPGVAGEVARVINKEFQISLTEEDIREMYGVSRYIFNKDLDNESMYPKHFYVRKNLIRSLEKTHPDQVDSLVRSVFFEAPFLHSEFLALSGFGAHVKESYNTYAKTPWEEIESYIKTSDDKAISFSIFGINLVKLPLKTLEEIKTLWLREPVTEDDYINILKRLAEIRREQKNT